MKGIKQFWAWLTGCTSSGASCCLRAALPVHIGLFYPHSARVVETPAGYHPPPVRQPVNQGLRWWVPNEAKRCES